MAKRARQLGLAAGAAILVLAAWTVGPALSLSPYAPRPVEFHQKLPSLRAVTTRSDDGGGRARALVRYLSPVIHAPKRFDLVGIGGERRAVDYRYRTSGDWSSWLAVDSGDPIWAGGAEDLQLRTEGFRPKGDLDYINLSGTDTFGHRVLSSVRSAVHGAFVSAAAVVGADSAAAVPAKPAFIPRSSWDPNHRCRPRVHASYGRVKAAVVHHTVTGGNSYGRTEAKRIVLGICLFHRNDNGWNDIGYNALSDRFGRLYVGRAGGIGKAVIGAQTLGYNAQTTGIASIGDHVSEQMGVDERHALIHFLAWKLAHHGAVPANGHTTLVSGGGSGNRYSAGTHVRVYRVIGHRRLNATECPGSAMNDQLPNIRNRAQARIAASG
jgi:hypothetical protein